MRFRRIAGEVEAEQVQVPTYVQTNHGPALAAPGDWIITRPDGERYPCADVVFRASYELAEGA